MVAFVFLGAEPEVIGDDAAEAAQEEELHHEAAGIDLADRGFAQVVPLLLLGEPEAVGKHGGEEKDDDQGVDDLLVLIASHAATSRFLSMKYPTIENGKAYARARRVLERILLQPMANPSATVLLTSRAWKLGTM